MTRPELNETLTALIEAIDAPDILGAPRIDAAEMEIPCEVTLTAHPAGLTAFAAPPQSRFESGFQNPIHRIRLRAEPQPGGRSE